jgi:hypothetical protein
MAQGTPRIAAMPVNQSGLLMISLNISLRQVCVIIVLRVPHNPNVNDVFEMRDRGSP